MVRGRLILLGLFAVALCRPAVADIAWKIADEGPRAPEVGLILGDDSRTLAFTGASVFEHGINQPRKFAAVDAFEFDGANWRPVALDTAETVKAPFLVFFAGGVFAATSLQGNQLFFYVLRGNSWSQVASLPWAIQGSDWPWPTPYGTEGGPLVGANGRVYVPPPTFNLVCSGQGACPTGGTDPRRLVSVSLLDGTVREEAPFPACYGKLFALSGQLYLIQDVPICGGPSSRAAGPTPNVNSSLPFFRLDGDHWTSLPSWNLWTEILLSTANTLWVFSAGLVWIFTSSGLSNPILVPQTYRYNHEPIALEWAGQLLLVGDEQKGNIYQLQNGAFVRMTPQSPVTEGAYGAAPRVFVAGSRLFTTADGWNVFVRGLPGWSETEGIPGAPGAGSYFMGVTKTYGVRGIRVFRRDDGGWTRLSPAPHSEASTVAAVWQDRPVVAAYDGLGGTTLLAHDSTTDSWEDLHPPAGFGAGPILGSGDDLYAAGSAGTLARFRQGAWSIFTASPPAGPYDSGPRRIREANGSIYVIGDFVRRLDGDHLTPAFTDLDPGISIDDIAAIGEQLILLVRDGSRSDKLQAAILAPVAGGYRTLVTVEDTMWTGINLERSYPDVSLAVVGDALLFGGLSFERGQLRAQRGVILPKTIDPSGRFGSDDSHLPSPSYVRSPLFTPSPRVRKNLAAVADTTGSGGVRYRSTLTVANFSVSSPAVARVFAGASTTPVMEVPLGPGVQTSIEDPIPDFVGPVAVEFDGLTDEKDAWAGVRVWNPSDGGTAGTSIVASNPGDLPFRTVVLAPPPSPGTRTHVALAASADGPGQGIVAFDYRAGPGSETPYTTIPSGGFLQVTPSSGNLVAPLGVIAMSATSFPLAARDDLLGYIVRNESGTNDGTIVPFEPPDTLPGRRTRFLPAVVAMASPLGRYRTELSLGWRTSSSYPPANLTFSATYRDDNGSWTFPFSIGNGQILSVEDAGSWLAGNGVQVDPMNFVGTLTLGSDRPEGAADLLVTAVVLARGPGASGDYGVSVPVINEVRWAANEAIVPGLREDASFRSNIAVANPEPDGGPPVTLSVSLRRASDGAALGTLAPVNLMPGRRFQFNRALRAASSSGEAYAVVSRLAGTGRFVAYGVMADNVTGDGTLFPMTRAE